MARTQHDYPALEREYITTAGLSIRELARRHEIKSWSTLNERKKRDGWDAKRAEYEERLGNRQLDTLVDARVREVAAIHGELLIAIRAAVHRFVADVQRKDDPQPVSARDLMGMMDKFLLLTGQATTRSESRNLDAHSFDFGGLLAGAPPDLLLELTELARANGAGAKPVGRGPLVVLEGTRTA